MMDKRKVLARRWRVVWRLLTLGGLVVGLFSLVQTVAGTGHCAGNARDAA